MKRKQMSMLLLCLAALQLTAQEQSPPEPKKELEELRLPLNADGSHYIKATFLNQVWLRFNQSNPGTTVLTDPAKQTVDIGLRRTRVQLYGQLTDHVGFYFQLGQNNFNFLSQNAGNRKLQIFFHDALTEYKVKKNSDVLYIGGGLTITNGLSRFSQPSIGSIMSLDVPVFAQATVDQTDEFARKLSVYARGQIGKLDYRLVWSDPFPITTNGQALPVVNVNASFATDTHHKQYQGFFAWNFFDQESHVTPYMTGTYLGKKKVFNFEAGFITQKEATVTGLSAIDPDRKYHDMNLWSVALFYDAPLDVDKGTSLNAYAGYFYTDYGQGYLRYNGIMNSANGTTIAGAPTSSFGNAFPMFGTGSQIYAQLGYRLKNDLLGAGNGTLMPYATLQRATFDRLDKPMNVYDAGVNWLMKGHTSKITLDWQLRPVYTPENTRLIRAGGMKSQLTMQYQIFF
ncbi:MAG: hypothetical protein DI538_03320 [Azospira oryzae]|nr:MAG: hypothetical protein DI538_03320 [Azospira oryzae]